MKAFGAFMNENDFSEMVKTSFGPAKIERNTNKHHKKRKMSFLNSF